MFGYITKGSIVVSLALVSGCVAINSCSNEYRIKRLEESVSSGVCSKEIVDEKKKDGLLKKVWDSVPEQKKFEIISDEISSLMQSEFFSGVNAFRNAYLNAHDKAEDAYEKFGKKLGGGVQ